MASKRSKPRQAKKKRTAKRKATPKRRTKSDTFSWDRRKEQAAQLLAEADFSGEEIAARVGVVRSTLYEWQSHPDFAARVEQITAKLEHVSLRRVICRRSRRLLAKEDRWLKLQQVIEARGDDPGHAKAPGGSTGLLVRRQRMLGSGDNAILVEEFELDAALLKELRELEDSAAEEAGQKITKHELTGAGGAPLVPITFIEIAVHATGRGSDPA